jgi:peptidoglycan biosynthesis protein MviN/MurJ (putative lipid II flippase)
MLLLLLNRRYGFRLTALTISRVVRIILAATLMAGALWLLLPTLGTMFTGSNGQRALAVVAITFTGASVYFGAAAALGVVTRETIGQLRRRRV